MAVCMAVAVAVGAAAAAEEVLVRVHEPLSVLDLLDAGNGSRHSWPLPKALAMLQSQPHGVAVLLNCSAGAADSLVGTLLPRADSPPLPELPSGTTGKSLVNAKEYMVAAAHPIAAEAGMQMLAKGGSATDAAVAVHVPRLDAHELLARLQPAPRHHADEPRPRLDEPPRQQQHTKHSVFQASSLPIVA